MFDEIPSAYSPLGGAAIWLVPAFFCVCLVTFPLAIYLVRRRSMHTGPYSDSGRGVDIALWVVALAAAVATFPLSTRLAEAQVDYGPANGVLGIAVASTVSGLGILVSLIRNSGTDGAPWLMVLLAVYVPFFIHENVRRFAASVPIAIGVVYAGVVGIVIFVAYKLYES